MPIMTRAQWVKFRDAAGVPSGLGKHDIGPLLDRFHAKQNGTMKEKLAPGIALQKAAEAYYTDLKKSNDAKVKAFVSNYNAKFLKSIQSDVKSISTLVNPLGAVKAGLTALISGIANVKDSKSWTAYWSNELRNMGTLNNLLKGKIPDPDHAKFNAAFPKQITSAAFLDVGNKSDVDRKKCVQVVMDRANQVAQLAGQLGWW